MARTDASGNVRHRDGDSLSHRRIPPPRLTALILPHSSSAPAQVGRTFQSAVKTSTRQSIFDSLVDRTGLRLRTFTQHAVAIYRQS